MCVRDQKAPRIASIATIYTIATSESHIKGQAAPGAATDVATAGKGGGRGQRRVCRHVRYCPSSHAAVWFASLGSASSRPTAPVLMSTEVMQVLEQQHTKFELLCQQVALVHTQADEMRFGPHCDALLPPPPHPSPPKCPLCSPPCSSVLTRGVLSVRPTGPGGSCLLGADAFVSCGVNLLAPMYKTCFNLVRAGELEEAKAVMARIIDFWERCEIYSSGVYSKIGHLAKWLVGVGMRAKFLSRSFLALYSKFHVYREEIFFGFR